MKFFKEINKFIFIFLTVFGLVFSGLPYEVLTEALESYIDGRNIVDRYWHSSKNSNVVDAFVPLGKMVSKLRINEAEAAVANNAIIMKGSNASAGTFYYMTVTNPNTFGAETTTGLTSSASGLAFVVEKASPVRNEKISGHIKVDGRLDVVRRNSAGTYSAEWNVVGASAAMTCDATAGSCWRPFDIGYEQLSGQGVVAYGKNATTGAIFYNIYNGSAWAGEVQYTVTGSTGVPKWIRLIPEGEQLGNRRSDRILMVMMDANNDIFAAIWNGSAWGNLTTITATTSVLHSQTFDGAWENNSGDALVVYAEGAANSTTPFRYKQFVNGTSTWDAAGTTIGTWTTSIGRHARLASNPVNGRDDIGVIMQASDLTTITTSPQTRPFIWSGSAMTAGTAVTAAESMVGANIGVAWEKLATTGEAVFVYTASDGAADTSAYQTWISGTGFATGDITGAMVDDSNNLTAIGSPNSSEVRIMGMTIDKAVQSQRWSGTGWNAAYSAALGTVVFPGTTNTNQEAHGYAYAWTPYSPWTRNWRWYDDEGSATPASALAAENTTATVTGSNIVRLRFQAAEMGGMAATASRKKLQYTSCATPDALTCTWTDVDAQAGVGIWRYADGAGGVDDTTFTTTVLTGSDATGAYVENGTAASTFGHGAAGSASDIPEWDYTIENNGATNGTTYYFRMWANDQSMAIFRDQTNNSTTYSYPAATAAAPTTTLTVSTSGSQTTPIDSGVSNTYLGGAFTFSINVGSATISNIKVSNNGTAGNLSDIRLYYDTDGTYSGGELCFNTTCGDGQGGTLGTGIAGSMGTLSSGTTYYVYVVADIANTVAGGLTVDLQITNPSTDVTTSAINSDTGAKNITSATTIRPNVTGITYPITTPVNGGRIGQSITINGAGFGATCDGTNNRVTIGGAGNVVSCTGTTFSNTSISITNFQYSSGDSYGGAASLLVRIGATDDNASFDFTVYPDITSLSVTEAREGDAVTINGNHFGTGAGANTVTVDGTTATGCTWSATALTNCVVPDINDANDSVTIRAYQGTGGNNNTYDESTGFIILPKITSLNIIEGQVGATVNITGNHFGSSQGGGSVAINGATAGGSLTWGISSISGATVPLAGTITGNVVVTRNDTKTSNGSAFTILPRITNIANHSSMPDCTSSSVYCAREYDSGNPDGDGIIKIIGDHLGATGSAYIGGVSATEDNSTSSSDPIICSGGSYTDSCIRVQVPPGIADNVNTANIQVTRSDTKNSNTITSFRLFPRITALNPNTGIAGDPITIEGNHLCQSGTCPSSPNRDTTDNNVTFNGGALIVPDPSDVTGWADAASPNTVTVNIPTGAATGNVQIESDVDGVVNDSNTATSNTISFTLGNATPASAANIKQCTDGSSVANCNGSLIPTNSTTTVSTIYFMMDMQVGTSGGTLCPQIELKTVTTPFDGTNLNTGADCQTSVTANTVYTKILSVTPADGNYHWRARVKHTKNLTDYYSASWTPFPEAGENDPTYDFKKDTNGPVIAFGSATAGEFTTTITWSTDEPSISHVNYGKTVGYGFSLPKGDSSVYTSSYVISHTANISTNLTCGQSPYHFQIIVKDAQGLITNDSDRTFNTLTCTNRIMRTIDYPISQETTQVSSFPTTLTKQFSAYIEEASPTVRNAYIEIEGISAGNSSMTLTAEVKKCDDPACGTTTSGASRTYTLPASGSGPQPFKILHPIATSSTFSSAGCPGSCPTAITVDYPNNFLAGQIVRLTDYSGAPAESKTISTVTGSNRDIITFTTALANNYSALSTVVSKEFEPQDVAGSKNPNQLVITLGAGPTNVSIIGSKLVVTYNYNP